MFSFLGLFWQRHPALLYGIATYLGLRAAVDWNPLLLIPIIALEFPLLVFFLKLQHRLRSRLLLSLAFMGVAFAILKATYSLPTLTEEGVSGIAHVQINSISEGKNSFGSPYWLYRGTIKEFRLNENASPIGYNIPVTFKFPNREKTSLPKIDSEYLMEGYLKQSGPYQYHLRVSDSTAWYPIKSIQSLAEERYKAKKFVKGFIRDQFQDERVATFLAGMVTGEFDDHHLKFEFSRFGLQHIMAISGFHFSIIAAFLAALLQFWMPRRPMALLMILLLSSYFIFLGCGASIIRAWSAIVIAFFGGLIRKSSTALNSLGIGIIVVFLFDPLLCLSLGFELSFLSTAAILVFFPACDLFMRQFWKKRPLSHIVEFSFIDQHGFLILTYIRQAIALTLAVHIVALPMMLFYFHKFPYLSLIYNLFFPFLVSISIILLLLGILWSVFLPFVGDVFHSINEKFVGFILNFTTSMPQEMDVILRVESIPSVVVVAYLSGLLLVMVFVYNYLLRRKEELLDIAF